jgi:hypothetical protein
MTALPGDQCIQLVAVQSFQRAIADEAAIRVFHPDHRTIRTGRHVGGLGAAAQLVVVRRE